MVPFFPPFTAQSSLAYVFNGDESLYSLNQENIITTLDQFYLTIGDDICYSHQQQQQPLSSNIDHYYNHDVQLDNNIPAAYNPTSFLAAPAGGNQLILPPPAVPNVYIGTLMGSEDPMVIEHKRRLDHNASERNRRKKINCLFSSLRSVLPITDRKKLSNPSTVAFALKYIPELQKKVELLHQKKQELLSSTSKPNNNTTTSPTKSWYSVQATQLGNKEISIEISTIKSVNIATSIIPISAVTRELEEENGLRVKEISSSESSAGRIFHHLMVEETQEVECESLREKILCLCKKWENFACDLQAILYD